ncbi:transmembrane protein 33 [Trichonephila inaurata madagascariensis]|uniref:Transmembrane protein 33 n=1 Tax=Trichonephila inaurata madagascariensis TaxID=2747483 RepID=A0A8X6XMW3_9ARAC|nr:transmembrane protein 33 [Trichonephila inaurata madagascariensis]
MSEGETNRSPPRQGVQAAVNHMLESKIDSLLWLTRLGTIVFTVFSMIPLFGTNPYTNYQRALMSSAATSALRLHQRMPRIQFTLTYSAVLLNKLGCAAQAASLSAMAENHQRNILKLVSFIKISMPITVIWLFRNPYTRTVFHEMRMVLEAFANTPGRSTKLKDMCYKVINYASYLAPPIPTQQ